MNDRRRLRRLIADPPPPPATALFGGGTIPRPLKSPGHLAETAAGGGAQSAQMRPRQSTHGKRERWDGRSGGDAIEPGN